MQPYYGAKLNRVQRSLEEAIACKVVIESLRYAHADGEVIRDAAQLGYLVLNATTEEIIPPERAITLIEKRSLASKNPKLAMLNLHNGNVPRMDAFKMPTYFGLLVMLVSVFAFLMIIILVIFGLVLCYYRASFLNAKRRIEEQKIAEGRANKAHRYKQPPPVLTQSASSLRERSSLCSHSDGATDAQNRLIPCKRSKYPSDPMNTEQNRDVNRVSSWTSRFANLSLVTFFPLSTRACVYTLRQRSEDAEAKNNNYDNKTGLAPSRLFEIYFVPEQCQSRQADPSRGPMPGLLPPVLLLLIVAGSREVEAFESESIETILSNNRNYNKNAYPTQFLDEPTIVTIQMYIEGMSSFRAQSMDFQVDIYFQEQWIDERLRHNGSRRILIKDPHLFNMIWHPDLYFANARTSEFHDVTSPNFLVWVYPNGTVWYDCRISLTVICMQNLARYPLDSQSCTLRILSYAYDYDQLLVKWNGLNPVETNEEIRMPDMRLRSIKPGLRNDTYATGVWSCATAEFKVDREIMHHVIQSYVPTALIVVISWFSFWLDVEAVPGRVSLSITTLLTLATQSSAARMALPQASYVKAIDVWMGACMTFVFSAMIEFTVVNYCCRRKPKEKKPETNGLSAQVQQLIQDYNKQPTSSYDISVESDGNQAESVRTAGRLTTENVVE
uniref:Neur_chan_LBD domain-containing protein n=1 Tax=Steinernema glaseri TaxID=37863 RepID=A0A1I7Y636_9BILA